MKLVCVVAKRRTFVMTGLACVAHKVSTSFLLSRTGSDPPTTRKLKKIPDKSYRSGGKPS